MKEIRMESPRMESPRTAAQQHSLMINTGSGDDVSMGVMADTSSCMDRFLSSPDSSGKKKGNTMQRKLADMLGPLLVGGRKSSSRPATPTGSSNPSTPTKSRMSPRGQGPAPMLISPRPEPAMCPAPEAAAADSLARMDVSDDARSKKSSADSTLSAASAGLITHSSVAPSTPSGHAVPHPNTPSTPTQAGTTGAPALLTPQLDRLLRAARNCALPPSPRAEPPPGSPAGTPNQTTLLALSHTVPPRMSRPHWCLEDYTIGEKLYTGYASTVYKAQCKRSGETVVLKIYTLAAVCDLYKYQIYREVRVHASLQHENIVTLYAAFQEGDRIIMVQEYADGSDLFTLLHKYGGRLSERLAVQMVLDPFLRVLHYLHTRAIVHRDIKPENILFTKNMVLKLGDFGLAIDLREERAVTRAGTLDYMAPEVLRCPFKSRPEENKDNTGLHYGARVDAWAVGVLTFELLAGFPPFFDQSRTNTEERIVTKTPEYPANISDEAKSFISKALYKSAADRPTIQDMLNHTWIDQYRARRSMRSMPTSGTAIDRTGSVPLPVSLQEVAQQAQRAAAANMLQQQAMHAGHAGKTRMVATQTNVNASTMLQQAMAAQPTHQMAMSAAKVGMPKYAAQGEMDDPRVINAGLPAMYTSLMVPTPGAAFAAAPPGARMMPGPMPVMMTPPAIPGMLTAAAPMQVLMAPMQPMGDASVFMNVGNSWVPPPKASANTPSAPRNMGYDNANAGIMSDSMRQM